MNYKQINTEDIFDGEAALITLSTPPRNIISRQMMEEIQHRIEKEQKDTGKKLIIIEGEGDNFSTGASVEEHKPEAVDGMLPVFHETIGKIINCDIPVLAKVRGHCLGGGFELALACTFVAAQRGTSFALPEIQLGVFPPPACILLPHTAGEKFASEMILTASSFGTETLKEKGLINFSVPGDKLNSRIKDFFEEYIQPRSASSLRIAHKASRRLTSAKYEDFIDEIESLYLEDLMSTGDAKEGIKAFLEGRGPEWENK